MPSVYLQEADYATYGITATASTPSQVILASSLIDGYLRRPEGLIWAPDANGNPCYMVNKVPSFTLTAPNSIAPGQNVVVNASGPIQAITLGSSQSGQVAILDRAHPDVTEAVIVNSVTITPSGPNVVQLANVQFPHAANALLEFDMVILEKKQMPAKRPLTNLSRTPIAAVLSGSGRYAYSRRGDTSYEITRFNMLAAIAQFGGPPIWEIFDNTRVDINPYTGQVWSPAGILLEYYSEIRFSYIAGFTYASLPPAIKQACALILLGRLDNPVNGAVRSYRAGGTAIDNFSATNLSDDVMGLLQPYRARGFV